VSYDDGSVALAGDALVIRRYYFPFGAKRIPYGEIEQVRRVPLTFMRGRYRLWGSGDFTHWFNLDMARPSRDDAFIIQVSGKSIKPVITPRDPDTVATELASHGVTLTTH